MKSRATFFVLKNRPPKNSVISLFCFFAHINKECVTASMGLMFWFRYIGDNIKGIKGLETTGNVIFIKY
jgi:hypothetical protein